MTGRAGDREEPSAPAVHPVDDLQAARLADLEAADADRSRALDARIAEAAGLSDAARATAGGTGLAEAAPDDGALDDDEAEREEDAAPDSLPVGNPSEYARRALNRERRRARDLGLYPTRRSPAAHGPRAGLGGRGRASSATDPQKVGGVLAKLMGETGWADGLAVGDVMNRWDEIVGDDIAEHCHPETFEHGALVLRAKSSSWAAGIRALASTLISRIEEEVGRSVVTEIKVIGPAQHSFKRGRWSVRGGRGPRDTWG